MNGAELGRQSPVPCRSFACRVKTWRNDGYCSDRCKADVAALDEKFRAMRSTDRGAGAGVLSPGPSIGLLG